MKVLFLPRWYPTRGQPYGGVFVREHARAAQAAGVEVAVLHVPDLGDKVEGLWRLEEETDPDISVGIPTWRALSRSILMPRSRGLSFRLSYRLQLRAAHESINRLREWGFAPDLIHAHVYGAGVLAADLGEKLGLPVVITEHSSSFPRKKLQAGQVVRIRSAFQRADRVLPVSTNLKNAIEAYGIEARFEVLPNTVDVALFHPARITAARTGSQSQRLLFVGSLEPTEVKGFPTLIEALKILQSLRSNWSIDVVGGGPLRGDYENRVAEEGLSSLVTFHGTLPKPRIAEMMRGSDLLVLPSRWENLPCVVIEAMASGLPVVSTLVGGVPELVGREEGILVAPGDPAVLAGALEQVMAGPDRYDRAAIAARAASRYGLEAIGSRLTDIYASVLAERRERDGVRASAAAR